MITKFTYIKNPRLQRVKLYFPHICYANIIIIIKERIHALLTVEKWWKGKKIINVV